MKPGRKFIGRNIAIKIHLKKSLDHLQKSEERGKRELKKRNKKQKEKTKLPLMIEPRNRV
jgi:hypothetical protein